MTCAFLPPGAGPRLRSTTTTRRWVALTTRCLPAIFSDLLLLQPMIDYVDTKERQGIFFEKPVTVFLFFIFIIVLTD